MDWFLYDNGVRHERVKDNVSIHSLFISGELTGNGVLMFLESYCNPDVTDTVILLRRDITVSHFYF